MGQFRNARGEEAGQITHADLVNIPGTRERFTLNLQCPHCGHVGKITWEENSLEHLQAGTQRRLIDVTPGFHAENGRTQSNDPIIVCNACDAIQPD